MRSPLPQRSRWSARMRVRSCGKGPGAVMGVYRDDSGMIQLVQSEFLGDPIGGAGEPFAQRFGSAAELFGNAGPVQALVSQFHELTFFRGQPAVDFLEQLL